MGGQTSGGWDWKGRGGRKERGEANVVPIVGSYLEKWRFSMRICYRVEGRSIDLLVCPLTAY